MSIGTEGRGASAPPAEWTVRVAVSVIQNTPRDVLAAWIACESFQRSHPEFWPDNRAMLVPMGVGTVTSVQRLLLRLEDLGILARVAHGGNRRSLRLLRRTSDPMTPADWSALEGAADARRDARAAVARRRAAREI